MQLTLPHFFLLKYKQVRKNKNFSTVQIKKEKAALHIEELIL